MEYVGAMKSSFPLQVTVNVNSTTEDCRTSSSVQYFTGCYGLPYPDHNYGAPPPAQSPPRTPVSAPRTPVSAPARLPKAPVARWPSHSELAVAHDLVGNDLSFGPEPAKTDDESEVDDSVTRCVCEFAHDDGYMICCDQCSVWQHIDCMGIDRNDIPETFFCERCEPRYVDKKRAIEMQKWKREELLKLALAQGNPTDLKKLGVNARKIMAFKQKHQYKKVKEKLPHKFRRKSVDLLPKQRKNKLKMAKLESARMKSLAEFDNHRNTKFVEADCNEYSPEVRQALAREKNHRLSDTVDTVLFIKLLAQLRNNSYLFNRAGNKGLVACEKIFSNQPIIEYRGRVMLREQCEKPAVTLKQRNTHILYYGRVNHLDVCVDASQYGNEARYLRRSCTPNAEVRHVINGERIHFVVYSRADVDMGAEITIPFDFNYRESTCLVECACTLSDCPIVKFIEMISSSSKKENALPTTGSTPAPITHARRKSTGMANDQSAAKKKRKNALTSPERNITAVKATKTPPSGSDNHSDSDVSHQNGQDDDKRKMTREERKLEAIMRAFENMEKKQGRRKTLTRGEHPVICTNRDDDITPEFVNDSPDRSLQSPTKHMQSPTKHVAGSPTKHVAGSPTKHVAGSPTKHVAGSPTKHVGSLCDNRKQKLELESRDVDVTSVEPKSDSDVEVKSEHPSPKDSPRIEVEEDYRHFLDAIKVENPERLTPKRESDTGTDDGGKSPSFYTPATSRTGGSESSAGETTPCPTSEAELLQSPHKKKGWRRRGTLTARRNNRVKSMNDLAPLYSPPLYSPPVLQAPPSPLRNEPPAFVHKTRKAINETSSNNVVETFIEPSDHSSLQSRLSPQEEFVEFVANSRTLSHLRRSSAGGVRGSDTGSSSYSTKKRWLKQAMTEDPGPMLPPPTAYSPDLSGGTAFSSTAGNFTSSFTSSFSSSTPTISTGSTPASPAVTTEPSWPTDSITPLKKRRLAWLGNGGIDSRDSSFALPVSPLVTPPTSQPATPTASFRARALEPPTAPEFPPGAPVPGSAAPEFPGAPVASSAAPETMICEPVHVSVEKNVTEENVQTPLTMDDDTASLATVTTEEQVIPCPVTVSETQEAPVYRPPTPTEPAPDDAPPTDALQEVNKAPEDVEEGEIVEDGKEEHRECMEVTESHVTESLNRPGTPPPVEMVDTDQLISDIDARLFDLERQIAGREIPPPPPPPPRPHLTAGLSPVMGLIGAALAPPTLAPQFPMQLSPVRAMSPLTGPLSVPQSPLAVPLSVPQSPMTGPLSVPQSPLALPLSLSVTQSPLSATAPVPQSPLALQLQVAMQEEIIGAGIAPSPTIKRKVSLADYRRRRQSTTSTAPSSPPTTPTSAPIQNKETSLLSLKDAGNLSLAPLPLPLLPEPRSGVVDPPSRMFSEPTLAERIAERSCEHKVPASMLDRPKSLAERLKSEFGLDTSTDD